MAGRIIKGGIGADSLIGFNSDDTIYGDGAEATSIGGNDTIYGGLGWDTLYGNRGNDLIYGFVPTSAGEEEVYPNVIYGGMGSDTIFGSGGADTITGGGEVGTIDVIYGGSGNDWLYGGDGAASAVDGTDSIYGGQGNDNVFGNGGNDWLDGGGGDDTLYGGVGKDTLTGSIGADHFYGGAGEGDIFRYANMFDAGPSAPDVIHDYRQAEGDKIDLSAFDANLKVDGFQHFRSFGSTGAPNNVNPGSVISYWDGADTVLKAFDGYYTLVIRLENYHGAVDYLL